MQPTHADIVTRSEQNTAASTEPPANPPQRPTPQHPSPQRPRPLGRPRLTRNTPRPANRPPSTDPVGMDQFADHDVISRARRLRPYIAAAANTIESKRRVPPALLAKLHAARIYRMLLPESAGGDELAPWL